MNDMAPVKFGIGAPLRRLEDNALITGNGRFTDDFTLPGMLAGYVLRSPHAHARFRIVSTEEAAAAPGVHLILTAADITHLNAIKTGINVTPPTGVEKADSAIPILCADTVRHVGDAVAFIVADTAAAARDASELVEIDYEPLGVIADTEGALAESSALVYPETGTNVCHDKMYGDPQAAEALFAKAERFSEIRLVNNRLVVNYIEPRACLAEWVEAEDRWSVVVCSQGAHGMQRGLAAAMGVDKAKIRVRTADVGGGFGTKSFPYREYPLTIEAARRLGRPVKWVSDRTEHFVSDAHGRDNVVRARMAMDANGRFLALDIDLIAAMGAYLHTFGPMIPEFNIIMATGIYDIAAMKVRYRGVHTHTTPTDAYRGAGRPEAAYLIERLVDQCAYDLGISRDEIRARNFIRPEQFPYKTPGGRMYDVGEFDGHMRQSMTNAGWDSFGDRNAEAKSRGKFRGIGMSTFIEACAFAGGEPAYLELRTDGELVLKIGTQTNGQGHATAYAQIAAEKLGISYDKIHVRQGDTDELAAGGGTGGSRSVPLGGVSSARAGEVLAEKLKKLAGDKLEASPADIELVDGEARVVGTDRAISFAEIAAVATDPEELKAEGIYRQNEATYPNGTHICEVEIDPATGACDVVAYTIVDDYGVTVNPILLAGQVHGGVVQGIGQCLNERVVYSEDGQLLSATLMDYALPRADTVPSFSFATRNVPSTTNALGIKGAGEAGTIGACPAVMNAVAHALRSEYGITHVDMPATPSIIWELIQQAKA